MDSRSKQSRNITASTLPQEIIHEEILPRVLEVKSLLKFRCVSISWRSLIDSKQFIKSYHQNSMKKRSLPEQRVIIHVPYQELRQCSLQSLLNEPRIEPSPLNSSMDTRLAYPGRVLGCCNGLVCIHTPPANFFTWNPSTRISKKLPKISGLYYARNFGFGWVQSSDEYKVFGSFHDNDLGEYCGKLYSSKTKSWKRIGDLDLDSLSWQAGLFVGEKLHWSKYNDILFLDLKSEVFGRIRPPVARSYFHNELLGVLGGCLSVLYDDGGRGMDVWVMKDCWERVVTLDHAFELLHRPLSAPSIVGPKGEILVLFGSTILVYYPQDNVFRFLKKYGRGTSLHLCVESLESPLVV